MEDDENEKILKKPLKKKKKKFSWSLKFLQFLQFFQPSYK